MRNSIVLASVLLLALLVWLWIARQPGDAPTSDSTRAAPALVQTPGLVPAGPVAERAPEPATAVAAHDREHEPAPLELAMEGEELHIVSAETKAPLAGVRVTSLELDMSQRMRWFARPYDAAGIRHAEREGVARTSDSRGLVRIPAPRVQRLVLASADGLFGMCWIEPETPRPWTLELAADGDWLVRASDALGAPIEGLWIGLYGDARRQLARACTDAQGLARFEHARYALERCEGEEFELIPRAILGAPVRASWCGRVPPTEPTEIRLPRLGLAEVALRDPSGAAWSAWDEFVWVRDASGARAAQSAEAQQSASLDARTDDGMRVHAQLGLELEAGLSSMAVEEPISALGDHPVRADELLRIELTLGSTHPIARMRLIGPDGAPLLNTLVEVRRQIAQDGRLSTSISRMRSDAHAQLLVPLSPPRAGVRNVLAIALPENDALQAVLEAPSEPKRGWLECGDVQLAQAPVLAAGRVLDSTGAPVAGAKIDVQSASLRMAPANAPREAAARTTSARANDAWNFAAGRHWSLLSDAEGNFELRSFERPDRVRAAVKSGSAFLALANWIEGEPGQDDYVLVIPAATAVEGRVLLPDALRADELQLSLKRAGGSGSGPRLAADGSWSASGLELGPWTVEVRANGSIEALAAVEFEPVADEKVRAADLDLRAVRVLRVELTDERGEPLGATGSYAAPGSKRANELYVLHGRTRLVTMHARIDASFEAPGRLRARVEDVQDGARVVLERGLPLRVRLRDASVLPSAPHALVAWLSGGGGAFAFDVAGEALVLGAQAGEQRLHLGLRHRNRLWDGDEGASLKRGMEPLSYAVSIPASGEAPELVLDVEAELIEAARAELEPR
jgi:hypothetical protein